MSDGLTHAGKPAPKQKQRYCCTMAHVDGLIEASHKRNNTPPTVVQLRAYSHKQAEFIANLRNSSMKAISVELETTRDDPNGVSIRGQDE